VASKILKAIMQAHDLDLVPSGSPASRSSSESLQGRATVVAIDDGGRLRLDVGGTAPAKRAASCLLEPGVGDEVWFVGPRDDRFVIAVLERAPGAGASKLRLDGDASIDVGGRLSVASEQLDLRSDGQLGIEGDELVVRARTGRAFVHDCAVVARELLTHATKSTLVGTVVETIADLVRSHSRASVRVVDEIDQLQAGNIEHRASSVAELAGEHTLINGSRLVKADAAQIHLG
jgi:hypothetical protein